ncbi:MAG: aspartate aminotransferase family protein [Pseudomonadota bacterium]
MENASAQLFERALRSVPSGVNSNTRARAPHPFYFQTADGPWLTDADGRQWLDMVMGNGAVMLGHNHPQVQEAVRQAVDRGMTTGVESALSVDVAELFLEQVPSLDMVRFTNTGTEAVQHALQLARHATGRRRIAKVEGAYHGWSDELFVSVWADVTKAGTVNNITPLAGTTGLRADVVDDVLVVPFNDLERTEQRIEQSADEIACLLLEPVMIDIGVIEPTPEYLAGLRQLCDRHGIVLLFDELLTGFNVAPGGAQARYGVTPDLATYGKALANGYPLAALAGREDLMRLTEPGKGPAFVGTFNGHAISMAACQATLQVLKDGSVQTSIADRAATLAGRFKGWAKSAGIDAVMTACGSHVHWFFADRTPTDYRSAASVDRAAYAAFNAALERAGVVTLPNPLSHHAVSFAHDDSALERLGEAMEAGFAAVAEARANAGA